MTVVEREKREGKKQKAPSSNPGAATELFAETVTPGGFFL